MAKKNSSRRTVSLYSCRNARIENALEAMENEISQKTISFNEVASDIRRTFIHEYLPLYFSKIKPSAAEFEVSVFRAISYYEAKIRFLKMLISKDVGGSDIGGLSQPSELGSSDTSELESSDNGRENSGDIAKEVDGSNRLSLSIFDASEGSGDS